MKHAILLLLGLVLSMVGLSPLTQAETLNVEYKTFYSHVRKLNDEETEALQFAFGFMNIRTNELCVINEARISTDKMQIPIQVTSENRFTVPSEKALQLANAMIIVDMLEANNICDISVQLETKPEYLKTSYTQEELQFLYQQYQAFFKEMGGFMSFMMPKVNGLTFQFKDAELNTLLPNDMQINQGLLTILAEDFASIEQLDLPRSPHRVTAITSQ